ncbi:MAG: transposase, partial [Candidatus Marsarchaeota archaeon]|nr:transposase [Candidatus Marsarchaeota archaeon]
LKTRSGNKPAYNGQAVVDKEHQVIVAADITQDESDNSQLQPMIESAKANTGAIPQVITADGGYYSPGSLEYVEKEGLDAYIPDSLQESRREGFEYDKDKDEYTCPAGKSLIFCREREYDNKRYRIYRCYKCSGCAMSEGCHGKSSRYKELCQRQDDDLQQAMALKIRSGEGREIYNLRKEIVEPVFGNIKDNIGLRRLLLRGLEGARIEYHLACVSHNIGKIRRFMQANRGIMLPA